MADQRKYRGKRVDNGKWAVGWYFVLNGKPYIYRNLSYPNKDVLRNSCEVHPASVSQSTGIKDKHGEEIYGGMNVRFEGHVGEFFEGGRREMLTGKVFYKTEGSVDYCFKVGNLNYGLNSNDVDKYEILPEGE